MTEATTTRDGDESALEELSTQPAEVASDPPGRSVARSPLAGLRRGWRQLTSMRTALLLLALLALGAIPGGFIPQTNVDPSGVTTYLSKHPHLGPLAQHLGLFNVFDSPWFAAIYLLLFTSLIGCLFPRIRLHAKALRRRPPRAPRRLAAMTLHREWDDERGPADVIDSARAALRAKRWRVVVDDEGDGVVSLAAEKGFLRETGNLVFHVALVLMLVGVAISGLVGYKGQVLVNSGGAFYNSGEDYNSFTPPRVGSDSLPPFGFTLNSFRATYTSSGEPASFNADIHYTASPTATPLPYDIRVNHPLHVDGDNVYLINDGYAVDLTVRSPNGTVASKGPVTFLSDTGTTDLATSHGVAKIPDIAGKQLGLTGELYADFDDATGASDSSALKNPALALVAYQGDLGLNSGIPQNDFSLDTSTLKALNTLPHILQPGGTWKLPGGDTVTFTGVTTYAVFQVAHDPSTKIVLIAALLILAGIVASLRIRRRRLWVRAEPGEAAAGSRRTVVTAAGLTRSDPESNAEEFQALTADWITCKEPQRP